jgi:hypothetical protein
MDLDLMWNSFQKYKGMWSDQYDRLQPPMNVDIPFVDGTGEVGETLTCTKGNWRGSPDSYIYQWKRDDADVTGTGDTYLIADEDAGCVITCVVTATNDKGSTAAPPSNPVMVVEVETDTASQPTMRRRNTPERSGPPTARR